MVSGAAAAALLLLATEALDLAVLPVASAETRAAFALSVGVATALSALLTSRLFMPDQGPRA